MDLQYKAILDSEPLPALADLEAYFTQPKSSLHIMLGYYISAEFVKFYVKQYGFPQLGERIAAYR